MTDQINSSFSIADKRALRRRINALLAEYLEKGGEIRRLECPTYEESKKKFLWRSSDKRKAPTPPDQVYAMPVGRVR